LYSVPVATRQIETIVKKSRFIATACFADSREAALQCVEDIRLQFPDAGHHCWAYLIGAPDNPDTIAMSDDGEPGGTAGKPILNVLQHKQVGNIVIVVSRYFGGIKLGAGGLVRAYSGSAQSVMDGLVVSQFVATMRTRISIDFSQEQYLRHWLSIHRGKILKTSYHDGVICEIELAESEHESLTQAAVEHGWVFNTS